MAERNPMNDGYRSLLAQAADALTGSLEHQDLTKRLLTAAITGRLDG